MERPDVLVVDDEVGILRAVRRTLESSLAIRVDTESDPREAVRLLETRPPRVLVTDFRMPGLTGVDVLRAARRSAPDTMRILLTGQADKANIIEAINVGRLFRFVAKPWNNEEFAAVVHEALDLWAEKARRRADHTAAAAERSSLRAAVAHVGEVQRAVLPTGTIHLEEAEAASSFTACEQVTGDYVDAIPLSRRRTALLLGDVCGHGVGAAVFVFTARALLRSGLVEGRPLAEVLDRTNRFLCRDMSDGRFLTLFAAIHDAAGDTLTYVNAGQSPPLVVASSGEARALGRTSLPLGLSEQAGYGATRTERLGPGDLLFAYTDGLIEARDADRELFGIERLTGLVGRLAGAGPAGLLAGVRESLRGFVGDAESQDDLALLAYRPLPSPAPVAS